MRWYFLFIPIGSYVVIDVAKKYFWQFLFHFIVYLIQFKMALYKLMDLDNFTIEERVYFKKWKNICWLISFVFFNECLRYFNNIISYNLNFSKMT